MSRSTVLRGAALCGLALVLAAFLPRLLLGPALEAVRVARRDLVQTLVLNGRVLAPRRVSLGAL